MPAQLPKTIVGNTVSKKASHINNDAARIYISFWKMKKINGVVIACDRRIPKGGTRNVTFITVEWVLSGRAVTKELNGRVSQDTIAVSQPIIF